VQEQKGQWEGCVRGGNNDDDGDELEFASRLGNLLITP
jgi:hypothetical protein